MLSDSVLAVLSAVRGVEGWVVSLAGSCFLSALWQSPLHHCCPAASRHSVRTITTTTHTHLKHSTSIWMYLVQKVCIWRANSVTYAHFLMFVCVFRSLSHSEQWRCLVSELIAMCYRMSDVVSPVVQSSSPEGLIPMDTDSGNLVSQPGFRLCCIHSMGIIQGHFHNLVFFLCILKLIKKILLSAQTFPTVGNPLMKT